MTDTTPCNHSVGERTVAAVKDCPLCMTRLLCDVMVFLQAWRISEDIGEDGRELLEAVTRAVRGN